MRTNRLIAMPLGCADAIRPSCRRRPEPGRLVPPRFDRGSREGCGDSMMGGIAAGLAQGLELDDALVLGAAAGAVNFLRHGLGTGSRDTVERMTRNVSLRPLGALG